MTNEPTHQEPSAALESDLADIRALLREAVAIGKAEHKGAETRIAAMTAATRLFSAATRGSEIIARLNGHVPQTRHTTVVVDPKTELVDPERKGPKPGQSYDDYFNSLTPGERADIERRVNAVVEKYRPLIEAEKAEERAQRQAERLARERGDPLEENPKTTSPDDLDDIDRDEDPEAA